MALLPIIGIPSSWRVPGGYAQILFAQGPASASAGVREVVIVMPKLASASAVAGTLYPVGNEQDIITIAGTGSMAHRAARMFMQSNRNAKLSYLGMSPTADGAPVAATATITYTTNASATGSTTVMVAGEDCSVAIRSADTPTVIGAAVAAVINSKTHLPVTAVNVTGTVTLTAKIAGISQGDGTTGVIRVRATITAGIGTTVATSGAALGLGTGAVGVEGSTTEAAQLATALSSLAAVRKYYILTSTQNATGLQNLVTHLTTKSNPNPGLRSVGICGFTGTLAAAQALATARNYERLQLAWQKNSEHDVAEIVGNMGAIRQQYEQTDSAYKFDSYRASDWLIKPAYAVADYPSGDDLNDAINDGVAPIASDGSGSYLVMSLSTRSKDAAGAVDDFRATETHRVSVADEFVDEMLVNFQLNYGRSKLKSDALLSDGTVDPNQKLIHGVVTASTFKPWIKKQFDDYEALGKVQDAAKSKASLRVVRDPSNSGRLECGMEIHAIDHLHQSTFLVSEVSTG